DLERGGCWRDGSNQPSDYLRETLPAVVDNIATLLGAARQSSVECIFTVIESLTADGRDRSLDYKVSGFNVPRGSEDAQVLAALQPAADEMVLPKCSSSVFISTNLAYKLRNLGCEQVVLVGGLTDQCVDSAIGFLVTCVPDCCYTHSRERQLASLRHNRGYCRQV
ncbi:hypothetical protein EMIHUDRAFT_57493, partial [Emiliania huxleyi CCMP1516]|uniref:Isochorismatase-like domain-containing protein n=2 Tax=Emiliania huxleyi TaxID=2903 RepID=A0A0D3K6U5_EMIH1